MRMFASLLPISLIIFLITPIISGDTLLFVLEHFRHGARGPCNKLDVKGTDYLGQHWDTLGELSPVGMRMQYLLGVRNRERYDSFLSSNFDPREIYIISSDVNRTIQSAYTQLMGLYPPNTGPKLDDTQMPYAFPPCNLTQMMKKEIGILEHNALPYLSQSFPLHIFNVAQHQFLLFDVDGDCEPIKDIREKNMEKEIIKNKTQEFDNKYRKGIMQFLERPEEENNSLNYSYINTFCDHLIADLTNGSNFLNIEKNGISLKELNETCFDLLGVQLYEVVFGDEENEVALMSMTPPMKSMLTMMQKRIELDKDGRIDHLEYDKPKFVLLSGHDTSLAMMYKSMNIMFNTSIINPWYAASMYFELYKREDNNTYYVRYWMNDTEYIDIEFDDFEKKLKETMWSDDQIEDFCHFTYVTRDKDKSRLYLIILSVLALVLVLVLIALIIVSIKLKKKPKSLKIDENTKILNDDKDKLI